MIYIVIVTTMLAIVAAAAFTVWSMFWPVTPRPDADPDREGGA